MILIIAEKNEVARAILEHKYTGRRTGYYWTCVDDVIIFATNGHMMRLKEPHEYNPAWKAWSNETIPFNFGDFYEKVPVESSLKEFNILIELMKKTDLIIHAGDADDEGQIIVDEIYNYANKHHGVNVPVKRVFIRDNEKETVLHAFANMVDNKTQIHRGIAAEGKAVLDLLFGTNITRACSIAAQSVGYDGVMYAGRVQSPVQGLVVNRDREIESHKKAFYYNLNGTFSIDNIEFIGKYKPLSSDPIDSKNRITDKAFVDNIGRLILNKQFTITSLKTTTKETPAPLPFNMATALAAINRLYKLPLPKIDATLQDLRLKHNLITYSRSDCRYLSEAIFESAPHVLASIGANDPDLAAMVAKSNPKFKSRAINNKKAGVHHGIIPTSHIADLSKLTKIERDIYTLICRSFIAQFMPLHKYEHTKVILDVHGYTFEATSKKILVNGWKDIFYDAELNDEEADEDQATTLQNIVSNAGTCKAYSVTDKVTAPKKKYNVASLILDMNSIAKYCKDPKIKSLLLEKDKDNDELHGSIGTSATQKEIVPAQFDKGMFVEDKKGNITSTQVCRDLFDMLPKEITNPDITALWFEQQELVAQGKLSVNEFIQTSYKFIAEQVNIIKNMQVSLNIDIHKCPSCNVGILRKTKGQYGYYWYCNNYKNGCSFKVKDEKGKPILNVQKELPKSTGEKCPECGSDVVERVGKFNKFKSCSNYPKCTWKPTADKPKAETTGELCPKCNAPMLKRKSKDGTKKFLGCSAFPKCNHVEW